MQYSGFTGCHRFAMCVQHEGAHLRRDRRSKREFLARPKGAADVTDQGRTGLGAAVDRVHPGVCRKCGRSEEHTSELQSLMRISYAVFCLKKKTKYNYTHN